eukprot:3265576-Rhodomonas_salina.1
MPLRLLRGEDLLRCATKQSNERDAAEPCHQEIGGPTLGCGIDTPAEGMPSLAHSRIHAFTHSRIHALSRCRVVACRGFCWRGAGVASALCVVGTIGIGLTSVEA